MVRGDKGGSKKGWDIVSQDSKAFTLKYTPPHQRSNCNKARIASKKIPFFRVPARHDCSPWEGHLKGNTNKASQLSADNRSRLIVSPLEAHCELSPHSVRDLFRCTEIVVSPWRESISKDIQMTAFLFQCTL